MSFACVCDFFQPLIARMYGGGELLCVVDVLAGGQGGSEDRTSLRGVAVNP